MCSTLDWLSLQQLTGVSSVALCTHWLTILHVCMMAEGTSCAGDGDDGLHNTISNVFWWAWNANSGDTKGLVQDDWLTINWNKIDWLASVGLTPWYANSLNPTTTTSSPSPTESPSPAEG